MPKSAAHASPELSVGDRVMCLPASLTGEVVGAQDGLIGVRYDLGYIQWENAKDLRRADPGETTGNKGLPPSDPLYEEQQAKIARSQGHVGFDDTVVRRVIAVLGPQFRTKDVSSRSVVLNAHPYAATQRNYHANFGRHLNANADALGIRLVSPAPHARGALWAKKDSTNAETSPAKPDEQPTSTNGTDRQNIDVQIDQFLREVGLVPADATDEHGWRHLGLGSSQGLIGVATIGDIQYLRVIASVMELPSDGELILPLLRDLLELNGSLPGPARAAVDGTSVRIVAMMPADGLSDRDIAFTIHNALSMADSLIQPLTQQYGGTARHRSGHESTTTSR